MGALQEEAKVFRVPLLLPCPPRPSPGHQGDGEPGRRVQGVGEGEGVDCVGVEGGADDGRLHCGGLHTTPVEDEGPRTQLQDNHRRKEMIFFLCPVS